MNKILVQIYEVQTPAEAECLIELGVDHIGSVVLSKEQWRLSLLKETTRLIEKSSACSSLILLFSDEDFVFRSLNYYRPDIVHFCESLTDKDGPHERCKMLLTLQTNVKKRFPDIKIMRSIPIAQAGMENAVSAVKLARMFEPVSDYFLTDTLILGKSGAGYVEQPVKGFVGITGMTCDWDAAAELVESSGIPVILAGGISPENVFDGIMRVRPAGVDSCTRTNAVDDRGQPVRFKKDPEKVKQLVEAVRRAEKTIQSIDDRINR